MNISLIKKVNRVSNDYEDENTPLKKQYLRNNINRLIYVFSQVPGSSGCFGTGYPFYALGKNFDGYLPRIDEQYRYNNELLKSAKKSALTIWGCRGCLERHYDIMPDLKQICRPCPLVDKALKPRKVINRLPDIDMWIVCADGHVQDTEQVLSRLCLENDLHTSDVDPIQTIEDISTITDDLKQGKMPTIALPIDIHIVEYSKLKKLISLVPEAIDDAVQSSRTPYVPIHPKSYRKTWQYDDEAYNFVHDFLFSFTEFGFNASLSKTLNGARNTLAANYSPEELYKITTRTMAPSTLRRMETPTLQEVLNARFADWSSGLEPKNIQGELDR